MPMGSDIRVGGVQLTQTRAAGKKAPNTDTRFGSSEGDMTFSKKEKPADNKILQLIGAKTKFCSGGSALDITF